MAASRYFTMVIGFLCDKGSVLGEKIKETPNVFRFKIGEKVKVFFYLSLPTSEGTLLYGRFP